MRDITVDDVYDAAIGLLDVDGVARVDETREPVIVRHTVR